MQQTHIGALRLEKKMSRGDLCRAANLFEPKLCKLENLQDKAGATVQARLAAALGVPAEELFDNQGWPIMERAEVAQ